MLSVILKLGEDLIDELYSDIEQDFLAFIIMEALYNVIRDLPSSFIDYTKVVTSAEEYMDDPDTNLMVSQDLLADVMRNMDIADGEDVESELYKEQLPEMLSMVSAKLCLAAELITTHNDITELAAIGNVLSQPGMKENLHFSTTHLNDRIMFMLSSPLEI